MKRLFIIGWYWLLVDCVLFAIMGLILAVNPESKLFSNWVKSYIEHFNTTEAAQRQFLAAPLGGTIFGFYVLSFFVVLGPLRQSQRWAWLALAIAFFGWFIVDSSMSAYHGAWFNIKQINSVSLLIQGIPLLLVFPPIFQTDRQSDDKA